MRLINIFIKKSKFGFSLVELVVVMAIMSVVTTFALSMLIAIHSHINNDLATVTATSDLRSAQDFFEKWYRLNDKDGSFFEDDTTPVPVQTHNKYLKLLKTVSATQHQTMRFAKSVPNGINKIYIRAKQDLQYGSQYSFQTWLRTTSNADINNSTTIQTATVTPTNNWEYYDIDKTSTNTTFSTLDIKSVMIVLSSAPLDNKSCLYIDEIGYYNGNMKVPLVTFEDCTPYTIGDGKNAIDKTLFGSSTGLTVKESFITTNVYDYVGYASIEEIGTEPTTTVAPNVTKKMLIDWDVSTNMYVFDSKAVKNADGISAKGYKDGRFINTWSNIFSGYDGIMFCVTPNSNNNARQLVVTLGNDENKNYVTITKFETITIPFNGKQISGKDLNFDYNDFSSNPYVGDVTIGDVYLYKIVPTTTAPTTTTTTTVKTTQSTTSDVTDDKIKVASVKLKNGFVSSMYFDKESKKLIIEGLPVDWYGENYVEFKQIIDFKVEFSKNNQLVKCKCIFNEDGKNREFSFIYSRRTT